MGSRPGMPAAVPCQTAGCTIDRQGGTLAYVRHHLLHLSAVAVSPVVCASLYWAVSLPARGLTSAAPSPRNRRAGNLLAPYVTACTSDVLFSFYQRMKARQVRRVCGAADGDGGRWVTLSSLTTGGTWKLYSHVCGHTSTCNMVSVAVCSEATESCRVACIASPRQVEESMQQSLASIRELTNTAAIAAAARKQALAPPAASSKSGGGSSSEVSESAASSNGKSGEEQEEQQQQGEQQQGQQPEAGDGDKEVAAPVGARGSSSSSSSNSSSSKGEE